MTINIQRSEIDTILKTNTLSRTQYLELVSIMLSGQEIEDGDYRAINQIFDRFRLGRVSIVDT